MKDQLEFVLYKMVCRDEISLAEAQHEMATDWIEAWKRYARANGEKRERALRHEFAFLTKAT
jgi:hypothetical protein